MYDYYRILNLKENASLEEIKQAYRKAALRHHPDLDRDNRNATVTFILIKNAYEFLVNNSTKQAYDRFQKCHATAQRGTYDSEVAIYEGENERNQESFANHLNFIFWDIEDLLRDRTAFHNRTYTGRALQRDLLTLLLFIEEWVLIPLGLKDHFMEARQLHELSKRDYLDALLGGNGRFSHFPYTTVSSYYYNLRIRLNKFLDAYKTYDLLREIDDSGIRVVDAIVDAQNYAIDAINRIRESIRDDTIVEDTFRHSSDRFRND
jgi:curved DNA-binding protein CbpA